MRLKGNLSNRMVRLFIILAIWLFMLILSFITMNRGIFEYNSMKDYSQVLEGRITGINVESRRNYSLRSRSRYNTYLSTLVVYTEDGEEKHQEFRLALFKKTGDSVRLARLPDGSLVPLFIQIPWNVETMILLAFLLLVSVAVILQTKFHRRAASSPHPVQMIVDDFDQFTTQEERMLKMVNTQAQTINTGEEVEISEEPEAVIPVSLRGKETDSFYSTEDLGEYEGVNLDDLIVEKLND
ncbi:MAG: hypothetical protein NC089_04135 [Bacteroides sp.]|nr:hypothetical protein [Bacteroides sp.]MCM1548584.1 hypothetical protein [Clostridium sp.]